MSSRVIKAALLLAASSLMACTPQVNTDHVSLDFGDVEDYTDFLEDQGDVTVPIPFKPEPLVVNAVGKIQAQPDIAVITATISAERKNESRAVNEMSEIINAVQTALKGRDIETGFTEITSSREFDEGCRNDNRFAQRRHSEIRSDFYFNQRLDNRGDTKTKRRVPKPRVAQRVCKAQQIKVSTNMVVRIQPANAAGDVLQALSEAGAKNSRLYGYDFTDYDALYQEAAAKAVKLAREKAQSVARIAGGTLGEIETFSVSAPDRKGRFGPQPNVIRPANRYQGQSGSVIDRHIDAGLKYASPSYGGGGYQGGNSSGLDEIIVTASKTNRRRSAVPPAPISVADIQAESRASVKFSQPLNAPASSYGSTRPAQAQSSKNTNALSISLLSGPQTISVAAQLGYTYETPLNGKIIVEPKDE